MRLWVLPVQVARAGGSIKGLAFWLLLDQGQNSPIADGAGQGLYGIRSTDSAWRIIAANAQAGPDAHAAHSGCHALLPWREVCVVD